MNKTTPSPITELGSCKKPSPTVAALLEDVAAGFRVLRTRDGLPLSDEACLERARNVVAGLIGNYSIEMFPVSSAVSA